MAQLRRTHSSGCGSRLDGLYAAMGGSGKDPLVVETGWLVKVKADFPGLLEVPFLVNLFRPFDRGERAGSAHSVRIAPDDVVTIARTWQQLDDQAVHIDAGRIVGRIDDSGNYVPKQ